MREKYESLSLTILRDLAKARGLKGISAMRKPELIDRMCEEDEKDKQKQESVKAEEARPEPERLQEPERMPEPEAEKPREPERLREPERQREPERYREPERGREMEKNRDPDRSRDSRMRRAVTPEEAQAQYNVSAETAQLDSGEQAHGILEVMPDGFGFIRCENYLPGENDIYVSPSQIRRFNLKTGDIITGNIRIKNQNEKFSALLYLTSLNGFHPNEGPKRFNFEDMTPIFPDHRLIMERPGGMFNAYGAMSAVSDEQRASIAAETLRNEEGIRKAALIAAVSQRGGKTDRASADLNDFVSQYQDE